MGDKNSASSPDYEKLMRQGFELQREFAPKYARQEFQLRKQFDPKLIREQQGLQDKFGYRQYQQQLQALQQLDPLGWYARQKLGRDSLRDLARGYIDPRQEALYNLMTTQTRGDLARRQTRTPYELRMDEQALRAGQSARGNIYGNAPLSAEALYKGARGQQLYQQRLQNAQSVYQQQTGTEKARAQAGSFLSLATPEQRISNVQGVQAPRGFGYVNPQAGQQAAAFGLANYPNQAAQGSDNPWATALGIVGGVTGAIGGSYVGIGPQAGGQLGSATGSALGGWIGSDSRIKRNIVDTGKRTVDGIPLVEFNYVQDPRRFVGVLAQDVALVRPEAVMPSGIGDYLTVDYDALGIKLEEVHNG